MLPTKFLFIRQSGFRGEIFFQKSTTQKQELSVAAMFVNGSELNEQSFKGLSKNASYQVSIHLAKRFQRRSFFQKSTNQKQELSVAAMFVNGSELNEQSFKGFSKDASYQVSIHLAKRFQRRSFFQKSSNQKQELPVVAMFVNGSGRNEQSLQRTFHKCFIPSFGSFGQAVSEEKIFFRNQPIRNKNCLWRQCLLMD